METRILPYLPTLLHAASSKITYFFFISFTDDLNFCPEDLDPCSDFEMEDSIEDFIDSALEKTYPSDRYPHSSGDHTGLTCKDAVIFSKEEFLASLELRPAQGISNAELWSPSVTCKSQIDSTASVNEAELYMSSSVSNGTQLMNSIPRKECSCLDVKDVTKAVYSTAHSLNEDSVRICPSTLNASRSDGRCRDCSPGRHPSERLFLPLFVQISGVNSELSQNPSGDCVHMRSESPDFDKDTADIMKWLKDSQHSEERPYNDHISCALSGGQEGRASTLREIDRGDFTLSSMDLETFVDLDDFLNKTTSGSSQEEVARDHSLQRTSDRLEHNGVEPSRFSQLKLSFLEEQPEYIRQIDRQRLGSDSNLFSEVFPRDQKSSATSSCVSPAWSLADSTVLSMSPSPLTSMDLPVTLHSEDSVEESSPRSQLALLKLFSDENALSLFLSDSDASVSRFT